MASTFHSRQLRHERAMDQRFSREHRALGAALGRLVVARAAAQTQPLANTRRMRDELKAAAWSQVLKPYYVGPGDDPFAGQEPRSPFALLLTDGVRGSVTIQAERQQALLRRLVRDETVYRWLTGPRPVFEQQGVYDPFHRWVDPNGYRLSDRVWRDAIDVRSRVDRLLDYHIAQGTAAVDIADELERFLTPGARVMRTRTPYGTEGSYAARRLARTEISAAAGRATVNASIANPFVSGVRWRLSASHGKPDICDDYATGGPNGDGVYPPEQVPPYPAHPHDLCALVPVPAADRAETLRRLRDDIQARTPRARALQGLFNVAFLVQAIMSGLLGDVLERVR